LRVEPRYLLTSTVDQQVAEKLRAGQESNTSGAKHAASKALRILNRLRPTKVVP
jgi:hypothetical protein